MSVEPIEVVERLNAAAPPGYGMGAPHPPVDDIVEALIARYRSADTDWRRAVGHKFMVEARHILLQYAWERATYAVRQRSPKILNQGLAALAIEDGRLDPRDSIVRMDALYRSAVRIGVNPTPLFEEAAELALNPQFQHEMRAFPARSPADRHFSIIQETMTEAGFAYEFQPWRIFPQIRRKIWWLKLRKFLGLK